jgi:hypothetical protein
MFPSVIGSIGSSRRLAAMRLAYDDACHLTIRRLNHRSGA